MSETKRFIQVVAAVIRDARGRVLLTRRKDESELAGLWEFPGGKIEPGESAEQALQREIREEIGIDIVVGAPLIRVPQEYPSKRLTLDVRRVASFTGTCRGCEGQALTWVVPGKLQDYSMPGADLPVVAALLQAAEYAITPDIGSHADAAAIAHWVDRAIERCRSAGPDRRVQLRAPSMPKEHFAAAVRQVLAAPGVASESILLSRDIDLAEQLDVGLHLNGAQLHQLRERPPARVVGASCHNLADLLQAQRLGCDFAVLSPVQATASHPDRAAIGWDGFADLRERVSLPIYALGGLGPADLQTARQHGAQGVAGIRGFAGGVA